MTILISSHLLEEVAQIATKIGIIHEGQLIQEIESAELNQQLNQRLIIDSRNNKSALSKLTEAGYSSVINKHGFIETTHQRAIEHPDKISRFLVYEGYPPTRLTVEEDNLESYFLRVIEKKGDMAI